MSVETNLIVTQNPSGSPDVKAAPYRKTHGVQHTPETLSASTRAQSLRAKGLLPEIGAIVKPGSPKVDLAALRESLNTPIPNQGAAGIRPGDHFDEAFQRLPTTQIKQYDHNPRTRANPAYLELKESIRSTRAKNVVLNVTRRPGDMHYICAAGGNTTLMALQELWAETQDPAYATVKTLFTKWTDETAVIINHLAENENRADICFWDKANAMVGLKIRLETERGTGIMGIDMFIEEIKSRGLSSNSTSVRAYIFAVEQLAPIGPWLTLPGTKALQPRINQLKKACQALGIPVAKIDTHIRQTLERHAAMLQAAESTAGPNEEITVDALATCDALDHAIAMLAQMTVDALRAKLTAAASHGRFVEPQETRQHSAHAAGTVVSAPQVVSHEKIVEGTVHAEDNAVSNKVSRARAPLITKPQAAVEAGARGSIMQSEQASRPAGTAEMVLALVRDIAEICSLQTLLVFEPSMPLGYYCEIPAEFFDPDCATPSGNAKGRPFLARCGWQFLVALSGQCNGRLLHLLPAQSRWRAAVESHSNADNDTALSSAASDRQWDGLQLNVFEFYKFVSSPELTDKFVQLWSRVQHWIQSDPKHFAMGPAS
jgi:ParB family protein of integrating conjugative element (PFGI_1 class)